MGMANGMSLTTNILLYNVEKILYPWRESILSALPVSDSVILMCCHDREDEWTAYYEFLSSLPTAQYDKILTLKSVWGTTSDVVAERQNDCLKYCHTDSFLSLQADEVLHEDSYKELAWFQRQPNFTAAKVRFTHMVKDFNTTFPFIYDSVIRLAKRGRGWFSAGDGVELKDGEGYVWNSKINLWHYGKIDIGRKHEAVVKEHEFQKLFYHLNIGFPDKLVEEAYEKGQLDYNVIFAETKKFGKFKPLVGKHPSAALPYIERMEANERNNTNTE
jgi:hypothetical protein